MISDGKEFAHETQKRGRLLTQSHYDHIWHALAGKPVSMMGDHSEHGGQYTFIDGTGEKVGMVNFDRSDRFLAGDFYGHVVTSGRILNQNQAFAEFFDQVKAIYGTR